MPGPNFPARSTGTAIPPAASLQIVDPKTGFFTAVGLNLIQTIWAAISGSGGAAQNIDFLFSLAQAPPLASSSVTEAVLPYRISALQVPPDGPTRDGYAPFIPADPVSNLGAWLPALSFGGGNTGITYSNQLGNYIAIGSFVAAFFQIDLSSKGSSTGAAVIGGMPFTSQSSGVIRFYASCFVTGLLVVAPPIVGQNLGGQNTISLINGDGSVTLSDVNLSNTSSIRGCMIYKK